MSKLLSTVEADFDARFAALLAAKRDAEADVDGVVAEIIAAIRAEGDAALARLTERFDGVTLAPGVALSAETIAEYANRTPEDAAQALELAAERIRAYHARQMPEDARWTDAAGVELGWRFTPVDAAGLYAPGGRASYPSSVLMNAIPAKVAGVRRLALAAPTPKGEINPLVFYAARLAGVDEIYPIGGAQAIAALAYGSDSIAPVDVIVGPGNAYVAAAKRQVFGQVAIDSIAGPSEVLVIADADNDPDWLALDLLAQAEHDEAAQAILITTDAALARATLDAVGARLETLARRAVAGPSWRDFGAVILARDLDEAAALADRVAPEHLQLCVGDPDALAAKIRHAGAIFLGKMTPEALGDYVAGPNHVLPTTGAARRASGLSVLDFMKRTTLSKASAAALAAIGPAAEILARYEGLEAHGLSVRARLGNGPKA